MGLNRTTDASVEPMTLAEAKAQMRVVSSDETAFHTALIKVARQTVEARTQRALITQTWVLTLDSFPVEFVLDRPPLQSVTSIQYVDTDGDTQTLSSSLYQVDTKGFKGRIKPAFGQSWPDTRTDTYGAVTVTYVAGYGDASTNVPDDLIHACKLLVEHLDVNRGATIVDGVAREVPLAFESLLAEYLVEEAH